MPEPNHISFSVAILAGGQSRRMGQNKALLKGGDVITLQRVINVVKVLTDDLFLVTNTPEVYRTFRLPMTPDLVPNKAALGGIYTAISQARYEWSLVLACDMPLLNPKVITFLAGYLNGVDVVCPRVESHPEALHTFYKKTCLPPIKSRITANKLKIIGFFDQVAVQYVGQAALTRISPNFNFLLNMNTPEDLALVRRLVETNEGEKT